VNSYTSALLLELALRLDVMTALASGMTTAVSHSPSSKEAASFRLPEDPIAIDEDDDGGLKRTALLKGACGSKGL